MAETNGAILREARERLENDLAPFFNRTDRRVIKELLQFAAGVHDELCDCGSDIHQQDCRWVEFVRSRKNLTPLFHQGATPWPM